MDKWARLNVVAVTTRRFKEIEIMFSFPFFCCFFYLFLFFFFRSLVCGKQRTLFVIEYFAPAKMHAANRFVKVMTTCLP